MSLRDKPSGGRLDFGRLLSLVSLLIITAAFADDHHPAGHILFTRDLSRGGQDTLGLSCEADTPTCHARRENGASVVLDKPISWSRAAPIFREYGAEGKLPTTSKADSDDTGGRKLAWHFDFGAAHVSGSQPMSGGGRTDSRVRVLEAELSALAGRAP